MRVRSQDRELRMEDRESPSSILYLRSSNITMSLFERPGDLRTDRAPIQYNCRISHFLMADGYYIVSVIQADVTE
jgi:hypothetical protein